MFPVNVACAFACATASFHVIELPLNALRKRYRPQSKPQPAPPRLEPDAVAPDVVS
jgi:peptidoglycan/LPS O-acetylase OafA/YrhL